MTKPPSAAAPAAPAGRGLRGRRGADRATTIGWITLGTAGTTALAAIGLWLIGGTPTTPAPSGSPHSTASTSTAPVDQSPVTASPTPEQAASPSSPSTPPATPATSPIPPPAATAQGDPMAGAIPDSMIQKTLDDAGTTTVNQATAKATRAVAWTALNADLQAGGWAHPRLQASAVTAPGTDQATPALVDVTLIWAATDPAGEPVDRQNSTVRLTLTSGTWSVDRIT